MKSCRCSGSSASSAASTPASSSATISFSTSCAALAEEHVLGAAQPDALGAEAAGPGGVVRGVGVGADPQPAGAVGVGHDPGDRLGAGRRPSFSPSKWRTTTESATGTAPANTSPVVPSMEMTSPSRIVSPSRTRNSLALVSTSSDSAPHTQVRPMPRATTAACEVLPPRLVRMPRAATMPRRSSGLVSLRTRMTSSPRPAHSTAVSESKTALPTAAPGEAFMPFARSVRSADSSKRGNISWASWSPVTRQHGLVHLDQALVDHVDRDAERRLGGALADARLQHPQLAALDGELDVAHVAVVALEPSP